MRTPATAPEASAAATHGRYYSSTPRLGLSRSQNAPHLLRGRRSAGLPVRSMAETGSTLTTSTRRLAVSRTLTLQDSRVPNLSSTFNAS